MKSVRIGIFGGILCLDGYMLLGILYTLFFLKTPLIMFPEDIAPLTVGKISFGMVLVFVISLSSAGLLLYEQWKPLFSKRAIAILGLIALYTFFVVEETFLYSHESIGASFIIHDAYIDYFGVYKVLVKHDLVQILYSSWYMTLFHSALLFTIGILVWKGRTLND